MDRRGAASAGQVLRSLNSYPFSSQNTLSIAFIEEKDECPSV
jgi:hypothetical protein